jgi:hypothetical protein
MSFNVLFFVPPTTKAARRTPAGVLRATPKGATPGRLAPLVGGLNAKQQGNHLT